MGMSRYIAFLRAVNVGGRTVKMTELKALFEQMQLRDVQTFIASGNVIFTSSERALALEAAIEAALHKALGYSVTTMVRSTAEVAAAATYAAFPAATLAAASLYVGFLKTKPSAAAVRSTLALQTEVDALRVHGREIYWAARKSISEATITAAALEKALQTPVTLRNINTVRRLAAKYPAT